MEGTGAHPPAPQAPPLSLQFLLQLVEETPVGALGDELLRRALDQTDLVQAQGIEAHGILRIVLPPPIIGHLLHRLEGRNRSAA